MQKPTKIVLISLAGLIAIGGVAAAAKGWKHGMRGHGMEFSQLTERYDADKDGKITQAEIDTNRTSWLNEFDGDKSGSLALAEFQNLWLKAQNERMVREFQRFDRDGNGQVSLDEYKEPLSGIVAQLDRDNDGIITSDEMSPRGHRMRDDDRRPGDKPEGDQPQAN